MSATQAGINIQSSLDSAALTSRDGAGQADGSPARSKEALKKSRTQNKGQNDADFEERLSEYDERLENVDD